MADQEREHIDAESPWYDGIDAFDPPDLDKPEIHVPEEYLTSLEEPDDAPQDLLSAFVPSGVLEYLMRPEIVGTLNQDTEHTRSVKRMLTEADNWITTFRASSEEHAPAVGTDEQLVKDIRRFLFDGQHVAREVQWNAHRFVARPVRELTAALVHKAEELFMDQPALLETVLAGARASFEQASSKKTSRIVERACLRVEVRQSYLGEFNADRRRASVRTLTSSIERFVHNPHDPLKLDADVLGWLVEEDGVPLVNRLDALSKEKDEHVFTREATHVLQAIDRALDADKQHVFRSHIWDLVGQLYYSLHDRAYRGAPMGQHVLDRYDDHADGVVHIARMAVRLLVDQSRANVAITHERMGLLANRMHRIAGQVGTGKRVVSDYTVVKQCERVGNYLLSIPQLVAMVPEGTSIKHLLPDVSLLFIELEASLAPKPPSVTLFQAS